MRWVVIVGAVAALAVLAGCADGFVPPDDASTSETTLAPESASELQAGTAVRDSAATRALPLARRIPPGSSASPIPGALPVAEPTPRMKGEPAPTPTATPTPEPAPTETAVPPTPMPTAIATPAPVPTAIATPAPVPTAIATPAADADAAIATPAPMPTAIATPVPTPIPTATPAATATPTPPMASGDLGIVEVEADEALAAVGLTHVQYGPGEDVPWNPGLFLLDVRSGAVEGWVRPLEGLADGELGPAASVRDSIRVSPGNRFVLWTDEAGTQTLHDRQGGQTHTWDASTTHLDQWWGSGDGERLLFRSEDSNTFVLVDGAMQPVSQFDLPPGARFAGPTGGYILIRECIGCEPGDRYHLVNLDDETSPVMYTWTLPWKTVEQEPSEDVRYQIELLDDLVTIVADTGSESCRVVRYDLSGVLRSDEAVSCGRLWPGPSAGLSLDRNPPDEGLLAAATAGLLDNTGYSGNRVTHMVAFDAITGREIVHVTSIASPWNARDILKLADSSALVLGVDAGLRIAAINGASRRTAADPDGLAAPDPMIVTNLRGDAVARLTFGPPDALIPGPLGAEVSLDAFADWGATNDVLRVRTMLSYPNSVAPDR